MSVNLHFLNVGAGDCTIVDFPERKIASTGREKSERIMMIDNNDCGEDGEYTDVINYFKTTFKNENGSLRSIFRFICTHPHKDHITGLDRLFKDSKISIANFWDIKNDFFPEDWENDPSPEDWEMYKSIKEGKVNGLTVLTLNDNSTPTIYWNNDEDRITILSPSDELYNATHFDTNGKKLSGEKIKLNEMPFVLLLKVNSVKILFASDAEDRCWEYILEKHSDLIKDIDILKAAHHGRSNGFNEAAVRLMNPKHIIFSNSEGYDSEHGAEKEYKKVVPNSTIYKTCVHGNIVCNVGFDGKITITHNKQNQKAA